MALSLSLFGYHSIIRLNRKCKAGEMGFHSMVRFLENPKNERSL
jgi:hypothetical protein